MTEQNPYEIINPEGTAPYLIICDHGSNEIPERLDQLGLNPEYLEQHIAIDIGARDICAYLCQKLNATAIIAKYSRLVFDLNRHPDEPDAIPEISDYIPIPGNQNMTSIEKQKRIDEIYTPYHEQIDRLHQAITDRGQKPIVLSIHSFTPQMDGFQRPWHIGIVHKQDNLLAAEMITRLSTQNPDLVIGDNKPYSADADPRMNHTIERHAEIHGAPSIFIEFRQDSAATEQKTQEMTDIFLNALIPALESQKITN